MRYGKPIKNKKHADPRYFLHEKQEKELNEFLGSVVGAGVEMAKDAMGNLEIFQKACTHKDDIVKAAKEKGGLSEKAIGALAAAMLVPPALLKEFFADLAKASDEGVGQALSAASLPGALNTACELLATYTKK